MGVPIDVDTSSYESAGNIFYDTSNSAANAVVDASVGADGASGMAGCDASGVEWAGAYDPAAAQSVQAGTKMVDVLSRMGDLLSTTAGNHADADTSSIPGGPGYPGSGGGKGGASVSAPTPPSADGSPGNEPHGWFLVADLMSWVWPNGNQGQLRSVGSAWTTAGQDMQADSYMLNPAISLIYEQTSPEVAQAGKTCTDVQTAMQDLGGSYLGLGQACNDYAQHLDDAHNQVIAELKSLLEWTAGIEIGGGILAFFTAGISEVAAQAAEATRCALAATRIGEILSKLAELARTVITAIKGFATTIGEILARFGEWMKSGVEAVIKKVGELLAKDLPELVSDGAQLEKKFKHAADFGVAESRGAAGFKAYGEAVKSFVEDPATTRITGTYRGDPAIINYNPQTGLAVVQSPTGAFISGWKLSAAQLKNVIERGSLGGG